MTDDDRGRDGTASAAEATDRPRIPRIAYLCVPACLSALLLLVFFPLILQLDAVGFRAAAGRGEAPYLDRWLAISAALFAISGLLYAHRVASARRARRSRGEKLRSWGARRR
jgi:hypothetical protein